MPPEAGYLGLVIAAYLWTMVGCVVAIPVLLLGMYLCDRKSCGS